MAEKIHYNTLEIEKLIVIIEDICPFFMTKTFSTYLKISKLCELSCY